MPRRFSLVSVALLAGAGLLLAGCSSSPSADSEKGPLEKYFSALEDFSPGEEQLKERHKKTQDLIAACMTKEGFEYIPFEASFGGMSPTEDDGPEYGTKEWAETNGYGFSAAETSMVDDNEGSPDPNEAYVNSLSESEQTAYYETLYGVGPTEEEMGEDGSYDYSWEKAGCQGAADHEVDGDREEFDFEQFEPLMTSMNAMHESAASSPEVIAVDEKWSTCMSDKGYTFAKRSEAQESISDKQSEYYETDAGPTPDQLSELRELEISTAVDDFTCAEKVDYDKVNKKVMFALEEQFITDHKSELDEYLNAVRKIYG